MHATNDTSERQITHIQVYGVSGSCVARHRNEIMDIEAGINPVKTKETGIVNVAPELLAGVSGCKGITSGISSDDALFCLLISVVALALFAIVWAVVMIVFSIVTLGGFVRRRFRTLVEIENENKEFLGRLATSVVSDEGVMNYPLGIPEYDNWMHSTFALFNQAKLVRQVSLLIGSLWGFTEIGFKLYQVFRPSFTYDLWPFRFVMILIFTPLILYSPFLEWRMRNAFSEGREVVQAIQSVNPTYHPDNPMRFSEKPVVVELPLEPNESDVSQEDSP